MSDILKPDSQQPDASAFPHLLKTSQERKPSLDRTETKEKNAKGLADFVIVGQGESRLFAWLMSMRS